MSHFLVKTLLQSSLQWIFVISQVKKRGQKGGMFNFFITSPFHLGKLLLHLQEFYCKDQG